MIICHVSVVKHAVQQWRYAYGIDKVQAKLSVWQPEVVSDGGAYSTSQIWLMTEGDKSNEMIEFGWIVSTRSLKRRRLMEKLGDCSSSTNSIINGKIVYT